MSAATENQLAGLTALLQLERDARHVESTVELGFLIVNDTRKLVPYRQAVLWEIDALGRLVIVAASGSSEVEPHAPYVVWLQKLLNEQGAAALKEPLRLERAAVSEELARSWAEFLAPQVLLLPLVSAKGSVIGGLLLAADTPWEEGHEVLLEHLAGAYVHAWGALAGSRRKGWWRSWLSRRRLYVLAALLLVLLFPVRQSVVAPAMVSARQPVVIAAPLNGVVQEVLVAPNARVNKGDVLFTFDGTEINSRLDVARKAMDVAQAEYRKNSQLAYACDECRARLPVLQAQIDQRQADLQHALTLQERLAVRADIDGTIIFRDRSDLIGRPVSVGERVMLLAEPQDSWLEIHLPVNDAVALEPGALVRFFLNIDPLSAFDATLVQTSYEPERTSQEVLAYTLMAEFAEAEKPRLGLQGVARIYSSRAPLGYYVLRRPIVWLRQGLGW